MPDETGERHSVRVPSKHIIPADAIVINKELGVGEFGVVQQGVWTNEEGERVSGEEGKVCMCVCVCVLKGMVGDFPIISIHHRGNL